MSGPLTELLAVDVEGPEFAQEPVGLFEVVADDLLIFGKPLAGHPLQPAPAALVIDGPGLLQEALIGGVSDQDVGEAKAGLAAEGLFILQYDLPRQQRH